MVDTMTDDPTTPGAAPRRYGGRDAADRQSQRRAQLIEAGLDQLGASEAISVRGTCKRAGLVGRYFYESFTDRTELTRAVYDHVVERVATAATAAVADAGADRDTLIRAGLRAVIRTVSADPRLGRVLFAADPALAELLTARAESSRFFVGLLAGTATDFYRVEHDDRLDAVAHFLVGGFGQMVTAWLSGVPAMSEDQLVDVGTELFAAVAGAIQPTPTD